MEKTESKLNKQLSKYYVDHACQISSPGVVANELNLEPSRVSDLRAGRRQLALDQAEKIKEIYGLPSASQGHWKECELLSSKNLHKQFIDNGLALHFIQLIEMLSSEVFIERLANQIYVHESNLPGYEDPKPLSGSIRAGVEQKNKRLVKEFKLSMLNKLLADSDFREWCHSAAEVIRNYHGEKDYNFFLSVLRTQDITAIPLENIRNFNMHQKGLSELQRICREIDATFEFQGFGPNEPTKTLEMLNLLYQISNLVKAGTYSNLLSSQKSLTIGKPIQINKKNCPLKEYVIVGKLVWEVDAESTIKLASPITNEGVIGWHSDEKYPQIFAAITPPVFRRATFKLFYTEQYQYLVEVSLFRDEYGDELGRCLLIEIEDRQSIFDELEEIFNYFKVDPGCRLKDIKKAVALKGGYIPGAIYLD